MTSPHDFDQHEKVWLLLPWLANGRLAGAERGATELHVQACAACREELLLQQQLCQALTLPDRVTYAPGPSFRKLLERIDGAPARARSATRRPQPVRARCPVAALWQPPGLAWTIVFALAIGLGGGIAYQWSPAPPVDAPYHVRTDPHPPERSVLHIALDRDLTIGEVEQLLEADGARVVEGPGDLGIFGVAPVTRGSQHDPDARKLRELAEKLSADPRVRWVEPLDPPNP